jgi:hypothetical protein
MQLLLLQLLLLLLLGAATVLAAQANDVQLSNSQAGRYGSCWGPTPSSQQMGLCSPPLQR